MSLPNLLSVFNDFIFDFNIFGSETFFNLSFYIISYTYVYEITNANSHTSKTFKNGKYAVIYPSLSKYSKTVV